MHENLMQLYDYVQEVPEGPGGNIPTEEGGTKSCERCSVLYVVHGNLSEVRQRQRLGRASAHTINSRSKAMLVSIIGASWRLVCRASSTTTKDQTGPDCKELRCQDTELVVLPKSAWNRGVCERRACIH